MGALVWQNCSERFIASDSMTMKLCSALRRLAQALRGKKPANDDDEHRDSVSDRLHIRFVLNSLIHQPASDD